MAIKSYKHKKRGAGRHVQLLEWFMQTEAWRTLPVGPRALYIELKRRYTGSNNGEIRLSHREAGNLLAVSKNTVGRYFQELENRGFIKMTRMHCLGPTGVGQTSSWTLTECQTADLKPATKDFMKWRENLKAPP